MYTIQLLVSNFLSEDFRPKVRRHETVESRTIPVGAGIRSIRTSATFWYISVHLGTFLHKLGRTGAKAAKRPFRAGGEMPLYD